MGHIIHGYRDVLIRDEDTNASPNKCFPVSFSDGKEK